MNKIAKTWEEIKQLSTSKSIPIHYATFSVGYDVFVSDGDYLYICSIPFEEPRSEIQIDFEDNYKDIDTIGKQPVSDFYTNDYTLDSIGSQTLSKNEWTEVYLYTGKGFLDSIHIDFSTNDCSIKMTVDNDKIVIPETELDSLVESSNSSLPLFTSNKSDVIFTPSKNIRFNSNVNVEVYTTKNNKKCNSGYVSIVKEM